MKSLRVSVLTASAAMLFSMQSQAALVSLGFSGTMDFVDTSYTSLYQQGDIFTGSIVYDTSTPVDTFGIGGSDLEIAFYPGSVVSSQITVNGVSFLSSGQSFDSQVVLNDIINTDDVTSLQDGMGFISGLGDPLDLGSPVAVVSLFDTTGSIFDDTSLPGASMDLSLFDSMLLSVTSTESVCSTPTPVPGDFINPVNPVCSIEFITHVEGTINQISVSAVPVPAAIWLFATGLLGLVGFARRAR